jgi:tetratricopeptide (TPR) repeat protein
MNYARFPFFPTLRLLAVAAACLVGTAHADDYAEVNQLLRAGKLTEALSKADGYLATKPTDPQMRFLKGVIQRTSGKQPEAIATFTKLTEDYPELPEPYNNLAVLYAGLGQYDKARSALEMAIRTNPSYATAHENLGDVYARLASQAYNKALQLDTDNSAVPPKLAIIREVFKPNLSNPKPAPASAAKPAPAATPTPAPAPAVPTPAPQAATPVPAPAVVAATTPPPVMPTAPAKDSSSKDAADVQAAVESWAKAWSNKNMAGYLGAYSKAFDPPGKQSRSAWEQDRRDRIVGKSTIIVKLENLTVKVSGNQAVVKFRQGYRADALSVSSRKTLDMVKTGDQWQIVKESTGN